MHKKDDTKGKSVTVTATIEGITIIESDSKHVILVLEGQYIRAVLGLVSVLVDDEIPALLEKQYVDRSAPWSHVLNVELKESDMFSGEW